MKMLLTGGTGYIGSAVLERLIDHNHEVHALVRSTEAAEKVTSAGATPVIGDITDTTSLTTLLTEVDGAIHTASPGDASSKAVDAAVAAAVTAAFAGTGKPYVHTGGVWVYGSGDAISEVHAFDPPALTTWRTEVESVVLEGDIKATVVAPAVVYGRGTGITALIPTGPRNEEGRLHLIGDGEQHWTLVHVDDLAALYVTVLEQGAGHGYVIGASGQNPTVRELAEAVAGPEGVVAEPVEASRARLGALFADALLLDQQADGAKARSLGWTPKGPSIFEELAA